MCTIYIRFIKLNRLKCSYMYFIYRGGGMVSCLPAYRASLLTRASLRSLLSRTSLTGKPLFRLKRVKLLEPFKVHKVIEA